MLAEDSDLLSKSGNITCRCQEGAIYRLLFFLVVPPCRSLNDQTVL